MRITEENVYDTIIIGGAAASLTAAIYAARRAMKTLVIAKSIGGQAAMTDEIQNYPGFLSIGGVPLMNKMLKQAMKSGSEIIFEEVNGIDETGKTEDGKPLFTVKTVAGNRFLTKTVILSYGKTPRTLDVPGEGEFGAKGVSYCVTCDGPLFKGKKVAVVGGGNSALEGAEYLSKICPKVYLIHRRDQFRGFEYLVNEVKGRENIEILYNSFVKEIKGEHTVHSIVVDTNGETKEFPVSGVFVEIGSVTRTEFIKHLVKLDEMGQVIVNNNGETFYPGTDDVRLGLFAAGDITQTPFKQIVVSAGEGCKAALQAYNYLAGQHPTFVADWVQKKKH